MTIVHRYWLWFTSMILLAGCREQSVNAISNGAIDGNAISTIIYSKHIQPIFNNNCLTGGCHNSTSAASALILRSWNDLFRGSKSGAVVVSGNAFMSHLMTVVNTDTTISPVSSPQMPLGRDPLPTDQIGLLARWIDEGAKNDGGELPFASQPSGMVLASNQSADLVAIVDIQTNLVMRYVKVGSQVSHSILGAPHHVRVDRQAKYFYVTLIQAQELWKFSAVTFEFLGKVAVPPFPADVILTPGGDTAYVTNFSTLPQIAAMVDTRTMQVIKTFTTPGALQPFVSFSHGGLLSHDGKFLYTINQGSGNLTRIELINNAMDIIALDTAGNPTSNTQPYLADESADGTRIYVSCYGTDEVRVIDVTADPMRATRIIPVGSRAPSRPLHVRISPDGRYVVSANQGSDDVTIIRTSDFSRDTSILDVGRQPHGVEFSPDGKYLYVTCENRIEAIPPHHPTIGSKGTSFIAVIDFPARRILRTIEVGGFAAGISIAFNPIASVH